MNSLLAGFGLGLSLILAIGAQNAFVLRIGLRREHVFAVCLTCALSDAILIAAGVSGFGLLVERFPSVEAITRWFGAAFLIAYALRSFYSAWKSNGGLKAEGNETTLLKTLLLCLAFTWLNPHVYLDTVVLVGAISAQYPSTFAFGIGAMTASFVFFFSLGYGARLLAPIFAKPIAWRILDVGIGIVMALIAWSLIAPLAMGK